MHALEKNIILAQSILFQRVELLGRGICDLRVTGEKIAAIGSQLAPLQHDLVIDAQGKLLLPGLHDHHIHLFATAAARNSLLCGPPGVNDEAELRDALERASKRENNWIRGYGFHESVHAGLDRHWLDAVCPDRPVRIQHRSGMLWIYNSAALARLDLEGLSELPAGVDRDSDGQPVGRFYNLDDWLRERLGERRLLREATKNERERPSLGALSAELASYGVTGITDTGANNDLDAWQALVEARRCRELLQRLLVMGNESLHPVEPEESPIADIGPLKIYLREVSLPPLDELVSKISLAHASDRAVAFHCVTLAELHFALAALSEARELHSGGIFRDRIEHASVADDAAIRRMAELRVTVVTQPHFIAERGDQYLQQVEQDDIPLLYRCRGFLQNGVALAAGSDAPYGSVDPWSAMRAATTRMTCSGVTMGAGERLTPLQALGLYGGDARAPGGGLRELQVGQPADLCLLDTDWCTLQHDLDARHVALTLVAGKPVYLDAACAMLEPLESFALEAPGQAGGRAVCKT